MTERLRSEPASDPWEGIPCLRPWYALAFYENEARTCCWARHAIGKLPEFSSWQEIWNHPRLQEARDAMREGRQAEICGDDCPFLHRKNNFHGAWERYPAWLSARGQAEGWIPEMGPGRLEGWKGKVADLLPDKIRREQQNMAQLLRAAADGKNVLASRPATLDLHLSYRCNLSCRMCGKNDRAYWLHPPARQWAEEMMEDLYQLCFSEGEPFFAPEMLEYLDHLRSLGSAQPRLSLVTNGLLATPEKLRDLRLGTLVFSVDGATRETYRRIRGVDGLEQVLCHLQEVKGSRNWWQRPTILIQMVVMRSNFHEIPKMILLARKLKVGLRLLPVKLSPEHGEFVFNKPEWRTDMEATLGEAWKRSRSPMTRTGLDLLERMLR